MVAINEQANAPIFIIGTPRSGTSLLRDLISLHPDIGSPPGESKFFPRYYQKYGDLNDIMNVQKLVDDFSASHFFEATGVHSSELLENLADSNISYGQFLETVMSLYLKSIGKRIWAEKTPAHVFHVDEISQVFDKARFIFILRDGRDVSLSVMGTDFDPSRAYRNGLLKAMITALWWRRHNLAGLRGMLALEKNEMLIISFEDLIAGKTAYMGKILTRLGIETREDELLGNEQWYQDTLLQSTSSFTQQTGGISSQPAGRWRKQMSAKNVLAFELIGGTLMEMLGYMPENNCGGLDWVRIFIKVLLQHPAELVRFVFEYGRQVWSSRSDRNAMDIDEFQRKRIEV